VSNTVFLRYSCAIFISSNMEIIHKVQKIYGCEEKIIIETIKTKVYNKA